MPAARTTNTAHAACAPNGDDCAGTGDARRDFSHINLVGQSPSFLAAIERARRLSRSTAPVLVQGETGTGKELFAHALHYLSPRRSAPFIAVNCGAIPESLIESELFGHVRGAFTDAKEHNPGVVAQARGGTLLLDEVDSLSLRSQVALLRFLQDREYKAVGAARATTADVRVIASTNANLGELVLRRAYRQDLLYRLNVLVIELPPLRERPGDAKLLAEAFLRRLSRQYDTQPKTLSDEVNGFLLSYSWPGNVRELENVIHRAFLMTEEAQISLADIEIETADRNAPSQTTTEQRFQKAKARVIADFERNYLVALLSRTHGNISLAARISGKERSRLGKLMKKYGLRRESFVDPLERQAGSLF